MIFLTECPRDAMQTCKTWIPTEKKIDYINSLMQVGFDILDCGCFINPNILPQMADSGEVINNINKNNSKTKLSVVIADIKGAEKALQHDNVDILGISFSVYETFQYRITNKNREGAFHQIKEIISLTLSAKKEIHIYFSMVFENPYGELYHWKNIEEWTKKFQQTGIQNIVFSDTTGIANTEAISTLFSNITHRYPEIKFGAHFYIAQQEECHKKLKTAFDNGCRKFKSSIKGIGGCSAIGDPLIENIYTEQVINFLEQEKIPHHLHLLNFETSWNRAKDIFKF